MPDLLKILDQLSTINRDLATELEQVACEVASNESAKVRGESPDETKVGVFRTLLEKAQGLLPEMTTLVSGNPTLIALEIAERLLLTDAPEKTE